MTQNLSSWFEKGRPSLFSALENACQQIDADLAAELARRGSVNAETRRPLEGGQPDFDWKFEYRKLQDRYVALDKKHKEAKELCYKFRNERNESREKSKSLHDLILAAEQEHDIPILGASAKGVAISRDLQTELQAPNASREGSFTSVGILENVQDRSLSESTTEATETRGAVKSHVSEHEPPESTQGESEGRTDEELPSLRDDKDQEVTVKEEPSSDGPIFVSERCANKRKRDETDIETPAALVKVEGGGSSPEMSMHRCDFNPHESIDLGEAPSTIWTPRKQRQLELEASQRIVQAAEDSEEVPALNTSASGYAPVEALPPPNFNSVLTPVNVNRRLPPAPPNTWSAEDKALRKGLAKGIQDLAEDGGVYKQGKGQPQSARAATKGRLDTLLNSPSVADDPTPLHRSVRRQPDAPTTPSADLGVPRPRALPFDGNTRTSTKPADYHTSRGRRPLADTTNTLPKAKAASSKPKNTSLKKAPGSLVRNKPFAELRAEDFKINPQANKGHAYAFSEVVRDKAERAALPGCVDEHCCGPTFRKLAESEYPDDPSIGEWRQTEQKLLEEYLGDYSYRLTGMSREERRAVWIEARTQKLADKHGKHKHHTSRMRSPPGYWDFDFPDTQELEAERAEAARREQKKIQERHREAMKPGGRWLFRDE